MKRLVLMILIMVIFPFAMGLTSCSSDVVLKIKTLSIKSALENRPYYLELEAENGFNYVWTFTDFDPIAPEGLVFDTDGVIYGSAAEGAFGTYTFKVICRDARKEQVSAEYTLDVYPAIEIGDTEFSTEVGEMFDETLTYEGGSGSGIYWVVDENVPTWITFDQNTGQISTAEVIADTESGKTFEFEVKIIDQEFSENSDTKTVIIHVGAYFDGLIVPGELFQEQHLALEFDFVNGRDYLINNFNAATEFTSFNGTPGDRDGEFIVMPSPENAGELEADSSTTFEVTLDVSNMPTKATSSEPVTFTFTFQYDTPSATITQVYTFEFAVRVWEAVASMPGKQAAGASAIYNNHIYFFGGIDDNYDDAFDIYDYDITADTWSTLPTVLPVGLVLMQAVVVEDKIYIVGGKSNNSGDEYKDIYVFDPAQETIEIYGEMNNERYGMSVVVVDGRLVIMGSEDDRSIEIFDIASKTSEDMTAQLTGGCFVNQGAYWNGGCYVFAGIPHRHSSAVANVDKYNPSDDTFEAMEPLQLATEEFAGALLGNSFYIIGGYNALSRFAEVQRYNFEDNTSELCGKFPYKVGDSNASASEDTLYVMGGIDENGDILDTVYKMEMK